MFLGVPTCCAPTGDTCGEGVLWSADEQAVYWTDINRFSYIASTPLISR